MKKICSIIISISFCSAFYVLNSTLVYAYPPGWSDDILLTPEDMQSRGNPDIAVDGFNNVWAVWDSGGVLNGAEILYSKRDSLGAPLIPETIVSNNIYISFIPRIATDRSNNIQFIWRDDTPLGVGVWHATLANDGTEIIPSHIAASGAGGLSSSLRPGMVINKYNEINIIWDEYPSGYNQMNYTQLDSLGNTIIDRIRVSLESVNALWPGIGVDSFAHNHMAYRTDSGTADRLTYSKLNKDGNILIDNIFFGTGLLPTLIPDHNQNIHIVYEDPTGPGMSIEYLKLDQYGNIIMGPMTLSTQQDNAGPHMALDSLQYLHVVWQAESSGIYPIIYTKLDTSGNIIKPPMQIVYPPHSPHGGGNPRIAVDESNWLHLVWVDDRLNPYVTTDIYYKRGQNDTNVVAEFDQHSVQKLRLTVCPNPFRDRTEITYSTEHSRKGAEIRIFDASGRLVRNFHRLTPYVLRSTEIWHGTDDNGNRLPAGVYFLQVSTDQHTQTIPVILLR